MNKFSSLLLFTSCIFAPFAGAAEYCEEVVVDEFILYYGSASCAYEDRRAGISCEPMTGYSGGWEDPYIPLRDTVFCSDAWGNLELKEVSCNAYLPNSRIEQITEEVCEDVPDETVARARVNTNEMTVYDQSCYWDGWISYTMVRQNDLYCGSEKVATVVDYTGEPYTDDNCYVDFHDDNYTRRNPGSYDTCDIRILRFLD